MKESTQKREHMSMKEIDRAGDKIPYITGIAMLTGI
jgi:hypothetical protein